MVKEIIGREASRDISLIPMTNKPLRLLYLSVSKSRDIQELSGYLWQREIASGSPDKPIQPHHKPVGIIHCQAGTCIPRLVGCYNRWEEAGKCWDEAANRVFQRD
jgi:hypothetical protein